MDSQPLTGLSDFTHESIVSCTWFSSIAGSQIRRTGQVHSLIISQLLQASLFSLPPLTTYEHCDFLLKIIDKASQIEEVKRDFSHFLESLAIRTDYLPCRQWKVKSTRFGGVVLSPHQPTFPRESLLSQHQPPYRFRDKVRHIQT